MLGFEVRIESLAAKFAPQPLCLNPPNGALLEVGMPSFTPIVPASSASAMRMARSMLVVKT